MSDPTPLDFGEWLPDLPDLENPGALIAKNCLPQLKSYRQLNSLASFTNALTAACLGSIWLQGSDNVIYNFAGDAQDLYRLDSGTTWTNVSKSLHAYSATSWEFAKFGNDVLGVDYFDAMQKYTVGTSSAFADQTGSPYNAKRIAVVRDFVVLGDLQAYGPDFLGWSGYNNATLWTPSRQTQSDRQQLFGKGGRVQKIVPGEVGFVLQEHSLNHMEYVGPPTIFQFNEIEPGRGTPAPNSVCWTGPFIFFYSHDGFYMFSGSTPCTPIGANKVNKWFRANSDMSSVAQMNSAVDRQNALVFWAFRSSSSLAYNDRLLIFHWPSGRFTYGEVNTEWLAEYVTSGLTLDQLDTPFPSGIDIQSIPVDTDAFKGGALSLAAFGSDHKTADFSGAALAATIDTKELRSGQRLITNAVRPIVDGTPATTFTVQAGKRNLPAGNVTFGSARGLTPEGKACIITNSRYQRYRVNIGGGFTHGQGVELDAAALGGRR
jgi:hypothetical protein